MPDNREDMLKNLLIRKKSDGEANKSAQLLGNLLKKHGATPNDAPPASDDIKNTQSPVPDQARIQEVADNLKKEISQETAPLSLKITESIDSIKKIKASAPAVEPISQIDQNLASAQEKPVLLADAIESAIKYSSTSYTPGELESLRRQNTPNPMPDIPLNNEEPEDLKPIINTRSAEIIEERSKSLGTLLKKNTFREEGLKEPSKNGDISKSNEKLEEKNASLSSLLGRITADEEKPQGEKPQGEKEISQAKAEKEAIPHDDIPKFQVKFKMPDGIKDTGSSNISSDSQDPQIKPDINPQKEEVKSTLASILSKKKTSETPLYTSAFSEKKPAPSPIGPAIPPRPQSSSISSAKVQEAKNALDPSRKNQNSTLAENPLKTTKKQELPGPSLMENMGMQDLDISTLLQQLVASNGSDLHLTVGLPPMIRIHGHLKKTKNPILDGPTIEYLLTSTMTKAQKASWQENFELDYSFFTNSARFRVNAFFQRLGPGAVFRIIPTRIMSVKDLALPPAIEQLAFRNKGLVLVTGPTGSGKSTTLAALIDLINRTREDHILTIEDPIEFVHEHKRCIINQREVGENTKSFSAALKSALREDPDVILVGELRDYETISLAITAAETGHLVFGTLHTSSAVKTIDRIIDVFPPHQQSQIRTQLSETLEGVIAQQLVPRCDKPGRFCATEILLTNSAIRNLIREGKTYQIYSTMQTHRDSGMRTLDYSLLYAFKNNIIDFKEAYLRANEKEPFKKLIPPQTFEKFRKENNLIIDEES